jgi:hypothetical protein
MVPTCQDADQFTACRQAPPSIQCNLWIKTRIKLPSIQYLYSRTVHSPNTGNEKKHE